MRIVAAAAVLFAATAAFAADHQVTHRFTSEVSATGVRRLMIDIPVGSIAVRNSTGDTIRLTGYARREYRGWEDRANAQRTVDDSWADVYLSRDDAVVRRRFGINAQGWRARRGTNFEITVEVPAGTSLEFATNYGEVKVEGSFGNIDVDLRAGDIDVKTPRVNVGELSASCRVGQVTTDLGDQVIERQGIFPGRTHFLNAGGRTRVSVHVTAGEVNVVLTR